MQVRTLLQSLKGIDMNSKLYRCGWCGYPTDQNGVCLKDEPLKKAMKIIGTYRDNDHTHKLHGDCCPNGDGSQEREMVQVTRDMASDAGEPSMEGEWIQW